MNTKILNTEVQEFINSNLKSDITKLILKGSPFETISIQEIAEQIVAKNKAEKKLTTWFRAKKIYYPNKLNLEQTSSEITAKYKSDLVSGNSLVDLTGGFGVDSYYFSKKMKNVVHCETNKKLSQIVKHNFHKLDTVNIETFTGDGFEYLNNINSVDWIYIDPSRRNDLKGKVFLLKDCLPNVPENIDFLFKKTKNILLKVSPILDITSALNELKHTKEISIVAVNNEVKELLFLLEKEYTGSTQIKTINFSKNKPQLFNFKYGEEATLIFDQPTTYLYEPNAAILKSGGYNFIPEKFNVKKLNKNSHLFTSTELIDFPGRSFKIVSILNYNKKILKKYLKNNKANITTRNFPDSVAQIRKKTGILDGGNDYLFFTTNNQNKLIIIACLNLHLS
ncbi:class I SAM-dependent methyltransferase [Lutibacter sp. TH_r2]|uniref:THUMP-like domain-containing protein n=1 Tax=Lutibacter sp. TH_r2 TaxID=3082083 RepID=UPI00295475F9|nr:class I SAM-dependent methyltransferase [Lutibacter sp. TH_r2]MDV7187258.1 class I SAM-dependent methyltransferase [Lutibacter sp. TH_r2]